jgi:starch synthase
MEVRCIMPRFGTINERRHRLHEVVRLSGINVSIDNDDYPLMIKVASLPNARLQIYFLDNEDYLNANLFLPMKKKNGLMIMV